MFVLPYAAAKCGDMIGTREKLPTEGRGYGTGGGRSRFERKAAVLQFCYKPRKGIAKIPIVYYHNTVSKARNSKAAFMLQKNFYRRNSK